MNFLKKILSSKPKFVPSIEPVQSRADYEVAKPEGRLFFRTDNFVIEVTDIKMTTPPKGWKEKDLAILAFKYDIFDGENYIKEINPEDFQIMIGNWIKDELLTQG